MPACRAISFRIHAERHSSVWTVKCHTCTVGKQKFQPNYSYSSVEEYYRSTKFILYIDNLIASLELRFAIHSTPNNNIQSLQFVLPMHVDKGITLILYSPSLNLSGRYENGTCPYTKTRAGDMESKMAGHANRAPTVMHAATVLVEFDRYLFPKVHTRPNDC